MRREVYDAPVLRQQFTFGSTLTIGHVAQLRQWLVRNGLPNALVIERVGDKNIVQLRVFLGEGSVLVEASWLNGLHCKHVSGKTMVAMIAQKSADGVGVEP